MTDIKRQQHQMPRSSNRPYLRRNADGTVELGTGGRTPVLIVEDDMSGRAARFVATAVKAFVMPKPRPVTLEVLPDNCAEIVAKFIDNATPEERAELNAKARAYLEARK